MPRKFRIDASGALYHIMVRGIEKTKIFGNNADMQHFLGLLEEILKETKTA
jgi:putative transposase